MNRWSGGARVDKERDRQSDIGVKRKKRTQREKR